MYRMSLAGSPCENTVSPRRYFTTWRAGPVDSRYASTSNARRALARPEAMALLFIYQWDLSCPEQSDMSNIEQFPMPATCHSYRVKDYESKREEYFQRPGIP